MNRRIMTTVCAWMLAACLLLGFSSAKAAYGPVPEDAITSMTKAMPAKARVQPKKARKLLIYSQANGFVHSSIPYGAKMLEIMGQKTGAFEAVDTTDTAMLAPAKLAEFDALVFNNTTGETFLPAWDKLAKLPQTEQDALKKQAEAAQKGVIDFVKSGKGVIGIHSATDANYSWPEYGEMMGGYFDGHPWAWNTVEFMKIEEPSHPLAKPFKSLKGQSLKISDEIYQIKDPYTRQNLRVLLSLDTAKSDMETNKKDIHRKDGDFAISWIREYGKGRVFYCSLGHNYEIFWNPTLLGYYLGGIQYALGDLKADATPSAKLTKPAAEKAHAKKVRRAGRKG